MHFHWSTSLSLFSYSSYSYMKDENDLSNMVGCLQIVRIYSFICTFSLLSQKIIILQRNKTCSPCLHSLMKTSVKLVRNLEQTKPLIASWVFTDLPLNSPNVCRGFHWAMKAQRKCFISL